MNRNFPWQALIGASVWCVLMTISDSIGANAHIIGYSAIIFCLLQILYKHK